MQIISDIKRGINESKYRYVIAIILFVSLMALSGISIKKEFNAMSIEANPEFIDYLILLFSGITEYIPEKESEFRLPVIWMAVQFIVALVVYDYINNDIKGIGQNILIHCKKKIYWWWSKCIWCIAAVVMVYCLIYGCAAALSIVQGNGSMGSDIRIFEKLLGMAHSEDCLKCVVMYIFIMPFLTSMTLSFIQICVSQVGGPMIGILVIMVMAFLSSYYMKYAFIGNYSMLLRSNIVYKNGIDMKVCIIINLIISMLAVLIGGEIFKKKDILEKVNQ